jgi:hypothetical protein
MLLVVELCFVVYLLVILQGQAYAIFYIQPYFIQRKIKYFQLVSVLLLQIIATLEFFLE